MPNTIPAGGIRPARTVTHQLNDIAINVEDIDRTRSFVVLHGGGGVRTVASFAHLLAERTHSRLLVPTHPGFAGTSRPERLATTRDLAAAYVELFDQLELGDVTVLGNSFGGWIAAEIALLDSPRVSDVVIIDGVGIEVEGQPMTQVAGLTPTQLQRLSFHDPTKAPSPPAGTAGPSPDIQALVGYTGPTMSDPTLLNRLAGITLPVHVVWGASDGIVSPAYGRAFADALPRSTFTALPEAGHLPQLEVPEELLSVLLDLAH